MSMHKKNRVLGFTIIELVIAVAIIGVLSALAVPAYQNYTIRAKVTEGLAYMNQYKTDVMEYYASQGHFPDSVANLTSNNDSSTYVESIEIHGGGLIYLKFRNIATYPTNLLFMKPTVTESGSMTWICANKLNNTTSLADQYVPSNCRNNIPFTFSQGGYNFNTIIPSVGSSVAMILNPDNNSFEPIGNYINAPRSTGQCGGGELSLGDGTYQSNNSYGNGTPDSGANCSTYPKEETKTVTVSYYSNTCNDTSTPHYNASGVVVSTTHTHSCTPCVLDHTAQEDKPGTSTYTGGNSTGLCQNGSSYSPACDGGTFSSFSPYGSTSVYNCGSSSTTVTTP
ncbi:MAG: prepilin-type N-terminal cleavage/methylation domain-containing protein [Neisseriaceae bacterium]|nr:MAG: prepilin-type N-terminal cleavage/methylation domain-containing protein [Neisseriaceae bacterium]